jgi:hypothetical protein
MIMTYKKAKVQPHAFLTSALGRGEEFDSHHREKAPVPTE